MDIAGRQQLRAAQKEDTQFEVEAGSAAPAAATIAPDLCGIFMTKDNSEVSPLAAASVSPFPQASSGSTSTGTEDCLISHANNTVFTALFKNGRILGLPCSSQISWKSNFRPGIPPPLQPTVLQMTTMHTSWIDRFPFPHMRDNFIKLSAIIDEEEFLQTLFDTHSFTIVPGTMSWDPNGWIMSKEFADKWGYLFY
ncbi:hypothetical protein A1O3_00894 [Capronia epimyces CBS 606.96]|uniref:Uncharacterized protein n=1 Tax=Capronia epimyces CBS 606.96 TaxID=1182542 RepID=W9ZCX6_9EURO|nr:uncharacterized protein A1O3_00894 [Capronia epimyces CBS 606.96]EXJ92344.1 hypothetical protein A1O3_00894 [Capronia epimyces CBS 606.96]